MHANIQIKYDKLVKRIESAGICAKICYYWDLVWLAHMISSWQSTINLDYPSKINNARKIECHNSIFHETITEYKLSIFE